jgi:hypothetical protein
VAIPEKSGFLIPLTETDKAKGIRFGFESRGRILWAGEIKPFSVKNRQKKGFTHKTKSTLVLHVGPHKTGSTAIQDYLYHSRAELAEAHFWYPPHALFGTQHALLPVSLLEGEHPHIGREYRHSDCQNLLKIILSDLPKKQVTILSTEVVWELLGGFPDKACILFQYLDELFDVHVFLVDRNQADRDWSGLKHISRDGFPVDVTDHLSESANSNETCLRWLEATGFPVERVTYDSKDTVVPFLEKLLTMTRFTGDPAIATDRVKKLIEVRGKRPLQECRSNEAPELPQAASFTLEFAKRLSRVPENLRPPRSGIAEFLWRTLSDRRFPTLVEELPPEKQLRTRVFTSDVGSRILLSEEEQRCWERSLNEDWLREVAAATGCSELVKRFHADPSRSPE